jgi:hypothetical protein
MPNKNLGNIVIRGEENTSTKNNEIVGFEVRAKISNSLVKIDDRVFLIISRQVSPGQYVPVYKSEDKCEDTTIKYIIWKRIKILTSVLCKEDVDREIRIDYYKFQNTGNHIFLGASTTTLTQIKYSQNNYGIMNKNNTQVG